MIRNFEIVKEVLARGKSLFTFRGIMMVYPGKDLNHPAAKPIVRKMEYWDYLKQQQCEEFILLQLRRYQVSFCFNDETIVYEMNNDTGFFKLIYYENLTIDFKRIHVDRQALAKELKQICSSTADKANSFEKRH